MTYDTLDSGAVQLTLPLHESQQLDDFLEGLIQQLGQQLDTTSLESTQETLGDAKAVAIWLRDYVNLELSTSSAIELLEVLTDKVGDDQERPGHPSLIRIRDQLRASLVSPCDRRLD
jgi:hypothetical protein